MKLRMHAFEYLIARRGFACTFPLEPSWNKAHILRVKWNCREAHPEIKIETKWDAASAEKE